MLTAPEAVPTFLAAIFGFFAVMFFLAARSPEERRFLLPLGLASFTLKAILVPLYYMLLVRAGLDGFAYLDAYNYHLDGIEVARELRTRIDYSSRAWGTVDPGYPLFTGLVYWITGPNTLVMRMLNCMFGGFLLLYVYRTARLFFEDARVARLSCYLVALLPFSITISINQRKEPIVVLLSVFVFYQASRLIRFEQSWVMSACSLAAGLFAMFFFRSGFVLPFIAILFLCYVVSTQSITRSIGLAIPTVLVMLAVQFFLADDASVSIAASAERIEGKILRSAGLSETGGLVRLVRMTSFTQIYKLPFATTLVAILPFPPLFTGNLPSVILSWANLLNLALLPHMLSGAWAVLRDTNWRRQIPLLIFPGVYLVLIGATHVGVVRYRETVFPIMLILAAAGLVRRPSVFLMLGVYTTLAALGGLVYFARFG